MTQMTKRQPVMHNIKFNARFFNHSISCVKKIIKKHSTHSTRKPRRKQRCTVTHRDTPWHTVKHRTVTLPWRDHYHSLQSKTWSLHLPQLEIWHDDSEASEATLFWNMFSFRSRWFRRCVVLKSISNFSNLLDIFWKISWGALWILHCLRSAWNSSFDLHLCSFHRRQKFNEKHAARRKQRCRLEV